MTDKLDVAQLRAKVSDEADYYPTLWTRDEANALLDALAAAEARAEQAEAALAEDELTLDLQRNAYMRAAERWRAARGKTAPTDVWPDLSDLCLWTLTEWDKSEAACAAMRQALAPIPGALTILIARNEHHSDTVGQMIDLARAALTPGAGSALLAERDAMRDVCEAARAWHKESVTRHDDNRLTGKEFSLMAAVDRYVAAKDEK